MHVSNNNIIRLVVIGIVATIVIGSGNAKADLHIGDAELMDEAINHPSSRGILGCSLSRDGLRFYFSMERDGGNGSFDIWVCERESLNSPWGEAANLGPNINGSLSEQNPVISHDELELYFEVVDRSSSAPWEWHNMRSKRASKDEPWGPPTEYTDIYPSDFSSDGLMMYFKARWNNGYGNRDVWTVTRATTDDDWGDPVNLGPNVNDELYQDSPHISHDDLALFLSDENGISMQVSIRRTKDSDWGSKVDISAPLCPENYKRNNPQISPDGRVLYFLHHNYGFTENKFWQASVNPVVDFTGDGIVDLSDLLAMIEYWGTDHSFYDIGPMPWGDGVVDDADLEVLMSYYEQAVDYQADHVFDVTPPHNPRPRDGWRTDVENASLISWIPGDETTIHDLFLGTDRSAVENAHILDTSGVYRGEQSGNSYTPPEGVQAGQTYYWRVDEVRSEDIAIKGEIWSFTVVDYIIVDDFESYIDSSGLQGTIFYTWLDGSGYVLPDGTYVNNGTGSTVGHASGPPWTEQSIVHGGRQSMPLWYDNDGTLFEGSDWETTGLAFYAEAQRTWAEPQDWTRMEVETLVLWFHGDPDNSVEPMYVWLEDNSGKGADVMHPDSSAIAVAEWQQWSINLFEFVGVDLTAIEKMYIGVGDQASTEPGGSGILYIDDIQLHLPVTP